MNISEIAVTTRENERPADVILDIIAGGMNKNFLDLQYETVGKNDLDTILNGAEVVCVVAYGNFTEFTFHDDRAGHYISLRAYRDMQFKIAGWTVKSKSE